MKSMQYNSDNRELDSKQLQIFRELTLFHYKNCSNYSRILDIQNIDINKIAKLSDIPYLPISIFKNYKMVSVSEEKIVRTLTSSGTSGQTVSKIYLDKDTAVQQTRVLAKLLEPYLGSSRMPMLVLDSESILKAGGTSSARAAGILGFGIFGSPIVYALDSGMRPNFTLVKDFAANFADQKVLIYGFTYIAWKRFIDQAILQEESFSLEKGVFIHGGGWKKMEDEALSPKDFSNAVQRVFGIKKVVNYYGMAEQTGSIFLECESGYFHTTEFSAVIIRNFESLEEVPRGQEGFLQTLSTIPRSYPGHSLLTEDVGVIEGLDDCGCGSSGIYFSVKGRVPRAEVRGCSDTFDPIN